MAALLVKEDLNYSGHDEMHISRGNVRAKLKIYSFKDNDTGQIVTYSPSLDVSGYGENKAEALEMINISIEETFAHLSSLSQKLLEEELIKYGWKKDRFRNKDYSKSYIDVSGSLKEFSFQELEEQELVYGG